MVKNPPAYIGDVGSIPVSGRSPRGGNATHSSILAWEIPWTEEPDRLQSMGVKKDPHGHDLATKLQQQEQKVRSLVASHPLRP